MRFSLITGSLIAVLSAPSFVLADDCLARRSHSKDLAIRDDVCPNPGNPDTEGSGDSGDDDLCDDFQLQLCCYGKQGPFLAGFYSYVNGCRFTAIDGGACPAGQEYCCIQVISSGGDGPGTGSTGGMGTGYTCFPIPSFGVKDKA